MIGQTMIRDKKNPRNPVYTKKTDVEESTFLFSRTHGEVLKVLIFFRPLCDLQLDAQKFHQSRQKNQFSPTTFPSVAQELHLNYISENLYGRNIVLSYKSWTISDCIPFPKEHWHGLSNLERGVRKFHDAEVLREQSSS